MIMLSTNGHTLDGKYHGVERYTLFYMPVTVELIWDHGEYVIGTRREWDESGAEK